MIQILLEGTDAEQVVDCFSRYNSNLAKVGDDMAYEESIEEFIISACNMLEEKI